jgi:hypothetical protein
LAGPKLLLEGPIGGSAGIEASRCILGRGHRNAVEIEEVISALAEQAFDSIEFPFAFLQAFRNKDTTPK